MKFAKLKKDKTPVAILIEPSKTKIYLPAVDITVVEHGKSVVKKMAEVKEIESLGTAITKDGNKITVSADDIEDIEEVEDDN